MKVIHKLNGSLPFYLFIIGVFLIITSPNLLSDGMFMDGLIYSTIALNLSNGIGSFWNPHFTATCLTEFHEHPPLAIGIHSLFYTLLGESRYIDKSYSVLTIVIVGFIISRIWKELKYKHGWLPILFWLFTPLVLWASSNNMLENTLTVFTTLSIFFYLKRQSTNNYYYIILSGLMLALGFLTKGFVAFFPWTFPCIFWFLLRKNSFLKMTTDSMGIFLFTIAPLIILITVFPEAKLSLIKYVETQVINSIKNITTVESRFFIVRKLFTELIPACCVITLFVLFGRKTRYDFAQMNISVKQASVFLLTGLCGVLPIMISMKQNGFYILPAIPLFAIGLSVLMYRLVDFLFSDINSQSKAFMYFRWSASGLFLTGIMLIAYFSTRIGRQQNKIKDTYSVLSVLSEGEIININPNMFEDWSLHGYYGRYKNVSLDPAIEHKRDYLLIQRDDFSDTLNSDYRIIDLQLNDYVLLKRN